MNVIRCKNGHFFDGDSYGNCPHCGESAMISNGMAAPKEEKKGFWGRGKKEKEVVISTVNTTPSEAPHKNFGNGDCPTGVIENNSVANSAVPLKKNPTLDFWQTSSHSESETDNSSNEQDGLYSRLPENTIPDLAQENSSNVQPEFKSEQECEKTNDMASEPPSALKEAVKNASASNEGKTMSYFSVATNLSSKQNQPRQSAEPVVGWLVCVAGCHFGECFSIYAGKNSIGRSAENRIIIADDSGISRVKHALIIYEPKKRNFFIQPGDSSGLTYLNGDYITESHKLSFHDMVELGESKFMFVPLCGEEFSWEDHMPKGE